MVEERANQDYGQDDDGPTGSERPDTDATLMTEGVGGMPGLDEDERATVSDVDGDNVDEERPLHD
jgi:hypothetical protein